MILEPGISVKKFSTKISPPKPLKTREKSDAPIRIKKTIELIFRVCRQTSDKITLSNFFLFLAIKIEPSAPNEADSVGVAMPNKIEPKTVIIRIVGGIIVVRISLISFLSELFFFW